MRMLNATGSRAVRAFHGLAAAIIVLGWSVSTTAGTSQDPVEITASAADPAGYIVLPKIVVQTSAGQLPPADNIPVDTRIQLSNLDTQNPIAVKCFFINSFPVCAGGLSQGSPCSSRDDCDGAMCDPTWDVGNFCLDLTVAQPTSWIASQGSSQIQPFGDPFEGELKCVQVNNCFDEIPVADNSLKAEATLIYAQQVPPIPPDDQCMDDGECAALQTCMMGVCSCGDDGDCGPGLVCAAGVCNQPPRIATAAYNATGFQVDTGPQCTVTADCMGGVCDNGVCTCTDDAQCADGLICDVINSLCTTNPAAPMCLGDLPGGQDPMVGCSQQYAPCPAVLILDHFFDHATPHFADPGNVVTTDLTLVPCSEDLTNVGEQATIVAQMLVYNEFEQKFSTSTRVQCFKQIQLSDIDTNPGPDDDQWSLFSIYVQSTLTGQTRIRAIEGTLNAPLGNGLIGMAIEHYRAANNNAYLIEAADAFQLHGTGFRRRGDVVIKPGPF